MKEYVVYNPKTDQIGELLAESWFGPTIFLAELPPHEPISNHIDDVIFSDQPERHDFIVIDLI